MKHLLFNKLKAELFFGEKDKRRKKDAPPVEDNTAPEVPLTE
jgi:hypothetical protein